LKGDNYDPRSAVLRFRSKHESTQTLPVTEEIRLMLEPLDHHSNVPYVWQLRAKERGTGGHNVRIFLRQQLDRDFREVRRKVGITRRITPHDLRRSTAVAILDETHDIRIVKDLLGHGDLKNTLWYLDHDLTPVSRKLLELIKKPEWRREQIA
jgi:site-specific recombinase XerC